MRVSSVLFSGLLSLTAIVSAANPPTPAVPPAPPSTDELPPEIPIEKLISDLSSDSYRTREDATYKIWNKGEAVLPQLKAIAEGDDPEAAFRATQLIRNIEHFITPETNPQVIELVERYARSNRHDKGEIINEIRKLRGWHQILKLFQSESDPLVQEDLRPVAHFVGVVGAREKLRENKPAEARQFLEMLPRDPQSLMSLAAFCRATGVLDEEIAKAKDGPADWRAALFRAKGDAGQASIDAAEANDETLSAAMKLFTGDALPWLQLQKSRPNIDPSREIYLDIMISRWSGKEKAITDKAVSPLLDLIMNSRNEESRLSAASALFILGDPSLGETTLLKSSALEAVAYYSSYERISECLAALGLDPKAPDYNGWVEKRFEVYLNEKRHDNDHAEQESANALEELLALAELMDQFGLYRESVSAFEKPLLALSVSDEEDFISFLDRLFDATSSGGRVAVTLAREITAKWAGNDDGNWRSIANIAFEEEDIAMQWWDWMPQLDPSASLGQRFDGMLGLLGFSPDPDRLGRHWLDLAWKAFEKSVPPQKTNILRRIGFVADGSKLSGRTGDAATTLKVRDKQSPADRETHSPTENFVGYLPFELSAQNRWDEITEYFRTALEDNTDDEGGSLSAMCYLHSYLAASLRRAGKEQEAAAHDAWAEKLALGDWGVCLRNSQGYAFGGDRTRSSLWLARAAMEAPTHLDVYEEQYLSRYAADLLEQGRWKEAAALAEAFATRTSGLPLPADKAGLLLELRLRADLPRALSLLDTDHDQALALIARCHRLFPSGGLLSDLFFPALRKVGLIREHDLYFGKSWKIYSDLADTYPQSHRLRNGAAWLASRAVRQLPEAEKHASEALRLNPDQAAYLDTMAEVLFAKGDRKAALKYSAQAVNFMPIDLMIRSQHERFANDPLPAD